MQAATASLRTASRQVQRLSSSSAMRTRALATAAASHADISAGGAAAASTPARKVAPISLANVEAQWAKLAEEEQAAVHEQLESLQVKDWKELSLDEKKAGEWVFGFSGGM